MWFTDAVYGDSIGGWSLSLAGGNSRWKRRRAVTIRSVYILACKILSLLQHCSAAGRVTSTDSKLGQLPSGGAVRSQIAAKPPASEPDLTSVGAVHLA
jgi:hypothetical protein